MKFEAQSSKVEEASTWVDCRSTRGRQHRSLTVAALKTQRGSVLVLVMTLLGILFVLGIALLASMNFEADMISAESSRTANRSGVASVTDDVGAVLRDTMMFSPGTPFGETSVVGGPPLAHWAVSFAEMPGVHNSSSPIEPYRDDRGTVQLSDDRVLFRWFTDIEALTHRPFRGLDPYAWDISAINTALVPGLADDINGDGELETVVDADGDGIVDSVQVSAELLGLSEAQLSQLSVRLNPPSNPNGKVYVGLRIIPHTGLVNLNASHPKLIERVFDMPYWPASGALPDPNLGNFVHRPTQTQVGYPSSQDEASLRRRLMVPPRQVVPSWLHGNPLLNPVSDPAGRSDMAWYLYPPRGGGLFETVHEVLPNGQWGHRSWPYGPGELFNLSDPDSPPMWAMRTEPVTSDLFDDAPLDGVRPEYDRRHLVTTVSHDDLLARGSRVAVNGLSEDLLTKMQQANQAAHSIDECPPTLPNGIRALPFEYAEYPHTVQDDCSEDLYNSTGDDHHCPTWFECTHNVRKGRMQLSLPWLDDVYSPDGNDTNDFLSEERRNRLIYDAFLMLLSNATGPYWGDVVVCSIDADCAASSVCIKRRPADVTGVCSDCTQDDNCAAYEYCSPAVGDNLPGACRDRTTDQLHRPNVITRTAAALTANLIDYADRECQGGARDQLSCRVDSDCPSGTCQDRGIPTRIALRSFDFTEGVCTRGPNTGKACIADTDCGSGGVCAPPLKSAGREFDLDPATGPGRFQQTYVYGLERQPFITEIATHNEDDPYPISGRAIEIFNPYGDADINATNQYYLIEYEPGVGAGPPIPLTGQLPANAGPASQPFTVYATGPATGALMAPHAASQARALSTPLAFKNGWIVFLIRRVQYPGDPTYIDIVVDQIAVTDETTSCIGKEGVAFVTAGCPNPTALIFSQQRGATRRGETPESIWTAPIPINPEVRRADSLGDGGGVRPELHPVELNFANLGTFGQPFLNASNPSDPRNGSVAFPSTGSMLMLMRHANRSVTALTATTDLAFTTRLADETEVFDFSGAVPQSLGIVRESALIDNGRLPVYERVQIDSFNNYTVSAHHIAPRSTPPPNQPGGGPGEIESLPWGQLVFDYFTALPLDNPGPYFVNAAVATPGAPGSQPQVDLEGLRVHGRININAAPWKVLGGLPFVPMQKVPVAWRDRIRSTLGLVDGTGAPDPPDHEAGFMGDELAQAIVAYRELRPLPGSGTANLTGNYGDGTPNIAPPGGGLVAYARGWAHPNPMARRGTGFMSVGELANVRHAGVIDPLYRIDAAVIDEDQNDNNGENFLQAAAALIALGDWVTVRSQVFTVYGVLRGEEDTSITHAVPLTQAQLRAQDVDSRAIRFQETIDRLPTVLGEAVPKRIGPRTVARYKDARND